MWDKSWMEHLVADVHVLLMAIVSAVNLGFSRPRRAIPLYRLGRQSRVVRILPGLPFLLAAIALFFFIIIPGDLSKRDRFVTCTVTPRGSVCHNAIKGRRWGRRAVSRCQTRHRPWRRLCLLLIFSPDLCLCSSSSCCWSAPLDRRDRNLCHCAALVLCPCPSSFPFCVCGENGNGALTRQYGIETSRWIWFKNYFCHWRIVDQISGKRPLFCFSKESRRFSVDL